MSLQTAHTLIRLRTSAGLSQDVQITKLLRHPFSKQGLESIQKTLTII